MSKGLFQLIAVYNERISLNYCTESITLPIPKHYEGKSFFRRSIESRSIITLKTQQENDVQKRIYSLQGYSTAIRN